MKRFVSILICFMLITPSYHAVAITVDNGGNMIYAYDEDQGIVIDYINETFSDLEEIMRSRVKRILVCGVVIAQLMKLDENFNIRLSKSSKDPNNVVAYIGIDRMFDNEIALDFFFQDSKTLKFKAAFVYPVAKGFQFSKTNTTDREQVKNLMTEWTKADYAEITYTELLLVNEIIDVME